MARLRGWRHRNFACNTNAGVHTLVGSFYAPCCVTAASGVQSVLDVQTATPRLAAWWAMGAGQCREGSLAASFDFTNGPFNCLDYWQGGASGAVAMTPLSSNRARIQVEAALPTGSPLITSIDEGDEVYSFKILIDSANSAGLGACGGCQASATICLDLIRILQPAGTPGGDQLITLPGVRNWVTWQGLNGPDPGCGVVPTRATTWGSIKSLYR